MNWYKQSQLSKRKRDIICQISAEKEEGRLHFDDPRKRLKWVHTGLGFEPFEGSICTVCPEEINAHNDVQHEHCTAAFEVHMHWSFSVPFFDLQILTFDSPNNPGVREWARSCQKSSLKSSYSGEQTGEASAVREF